MAKLLITDDEITIIEELSGCNYSPEKIALYLDADKREFMKLWQTKDSLVRIAYDRGKLVASYEVNKKQKENAQSGNITAAQIFLKESKEEEAKNILNNVLYGDEY
ncbi:MAG: hypothetical protein Q4G18_03335 [Myroides sp.]|nr:hypothetical protein [Myroides sp.]